MMKEEDNNSLDIIKKLMILDLVMDGVKQGDIAKVVGVSDATISEMFPKGLLKTYRGARKK